MTKLTMLGLLIAAFLYAAWLVLRREAPSPDERPAGRRKVFLFLTLYFMSCLGVSVAGEEAEPICRPYDLRTSEEPVVPLSEAVKSAWIALKHAGRDDFHLYVGDEEERREFAEALISVSRLWRENP